MLVTMVQDVDLEFPESHHHEAKLLTCFKFSRICVWLALSLIVLLCFVRWVILRLQSQSYTNTTAQEFGLHSMKHHHAHLRFLQATDAPHTNISVTAACNVTPYPKLCDGMLQSFGSVLDDPQVYVLGALTPLVATANQILQNVTQCRDSMPLDLNLTILAFNGCVDDYGHFINYINSSISTVQQFNYASPGFQLSDLQESMGAALAYHQDCLGTLQRLPLQNGTICGAQDVTFSSSSDLLEHLLSNALSLINTLL